MMENEMQQQVYTPEQRERIVKAIFSADVTEIENIKKELSGKRVVLTTFLDWLKFNSYACGKFGDYEIVITPFIHPNLKAYFEKQINLNLEIENIEKEINLHPEKENELVEAFEKKMNLYKSEVQVGSGPGI